MRGAGGTSGGLVEFFIGLAMFVVGMFLFLSNITVQNHFGLGTSIFRIGGTGGYDFVTGMVLIPFIFGVGIIFYNKKNILGWILSGGSILLLVIGMIVSVQFIWRPMSLFGFIMLLVLIFGGLGLFLKSIKGSEV